MSSLTLLQVGDCLRVRKHQFIILTILTKNISIQYKKIFDLALCWVSGWLRILKTTPPSLLDTMDCCTSLVLAPSALVRRAVTVTVPSGQKWG